MLNKENAIHIRKPTVVIQPTSGWRSLRLREVWEFRGLLMALGMRDVKLVYKQTFLGAAWVILQPLIGATIFTFVFGVLAEFPSGNRPYFVFAFAGMLAWTLFSSTLTSTSMVMLGNSHLVNKVYFPRLILPLSGAIQPLVNFFVGCVFIVPLLLLHQIWPDWTIIGVGVAAISLVSLALGIGLWCSSVMIRYRDLRFIIPVATQFLLYASPVGYSVVAVNAKVPAEYHFLYMLNPLATLIELFRLGLVGEGTVQIAWLAYSVAISFIVLLLGAYSFKRNERAAADML